MRSLETQCVISGGGPAVLMTGYVLARQGVDVILLKKHADFLRDFRGDTVHPSTLELFHELSLLDGLLTRPHQKIHQASVTISGQCFKVADFAQLTTDCKYIAMMPQWDFLDCLADEAHKYPNFRLLQLTKAEDLIDHKGKIVGVRASEKNDQSHNPTSQKRNIEPQCGPKSDGMRSQPMGGWLGRKPQATINAAEVKLSWAAGRR